MGKGQTPIQALVYLLGVAVVGSAMLPVINMASDMATDNYVPKDEHQEIVNQKDQRIENLRSDKASLQTTLSNVNDTLQDYKENASKYESRINSLENENQELENNNTELRDENRKLRERLNGTIPISKIDDYRLNWEDFKMNLGVTLKVGVVLTITLLSINLFGYEGQFALKQILIDLKNWTNRELLEIKSKISSIISTISVRLGLEKS